MKIPPEVRFRFRGHNEYGKARVFLFQDTGRTGFPYLSVSITIAQLSRYNIRLQDAPRLCLEVISLRVPGQPAGARLSFALSDTDIATAIAATTPITRSNKKVGKAAARGMRRPG